LNSTRPTDDDTENTSTDDSRSASGQSITGSSIIQFRPALQKRALSQNTVNKNLRNPKVPINRTKRYNYIDNLIQISRTASIRRCLECSQIKKSGYLLIAGGGEVLSRLRCLLLVPEGVRSFADSLCPVFWAFLECYLVRIYLCYCYAVERISLLKHVPINNNGGVGACVKYSLYPPPDVKVFAGRV